MWSPDHALSNEGRREGKARDAVPSRALWSHHGG